MNWFNSLAAANKVMVGGFLLLFLAVLALLPLSFLVHPESGFADAHTPLSEGFLAPEYPHVPIGVCVASNALAVATADDERVVSEAARTFNDRVGFSLLDVGNTATYARGCSITVTVGIRSDPAHWRDIDGSAARCADGCCIETVSRTDRTPFILQHQLGHCLGLVHDDSPTSVMYPDLGSQERHPRISDNDRSLLISRYH